MKPFLILLLTAAQDNAIAAIKKLGGNVMVDAKSGEVTVFFTDTQITDAGLVHLKGLTSLTVLGLFGTQITDAELEHLKGLNSLTYLYLNGTKLSDAGLVHLKGLNSLTYLYLTGTQVTDAGLAEIKAALPECRVSN